MPRKTRFELFQSHCNQDPSGCTLWTGTLSKLGYGRMCVGNGRWKFAHRWLWEQINGPVPQGLFVLHSCDVRNCVNPLHLRLGTLKDNSKDMVTRDRSTRGERHHNAKLTNEQVSEILFLTSQRVPRSEIARRFGVIPTNISYITSGKAWKHIPRPDLSNKRVGGTKLLPYQVLQIRDSLAIGASGAELARRYGVSDGAISMIKLGKTHRGL
jgi:hypothetical protein